MDIRAILKVETRILLIIAIALSCCIPLALIFHESLRPFIYSFGVVGFITLILYLITRHYTVENLNKKEAYLSVTLAWIFISLFGSLPFIFSHFFPTIADAFFESTSGFTTTGASILTDIESLPKSILFWRSLTHWIGGIGIIVLAIVVMPQLKIGAYNLFSVESSLQEKIKPRIISVGYRLLIIYVALTAFETLFLLMGGMSFFESVCHSFGTIATGGFSPKNTSIMEYSHYIQYVIMVFMLLAGTNFLIHYSAFKGTFSKIKQNSEFKAYLTIVFVAGLIITLILYSQTNRGFEESFRDAYFQVISIITCTGFATSDYLLWPQVAWLLIFFLLFVGGSTGSTAGGIKVARHHIAIKNIRMYFYMLLHPRAVKIFKYNNTELKPNQVQSVMTFIFWYMFAFLCGSIILISLGVDIPSATSSIATAMGGIGPGIGTVGPASNFHHFSGVIKVIIALFMILGRLEIYSFLILFTRSFWKR